MDENLDVVNRVMKKVLFITNENDLSMTAWTEHTEFDDLEKELGRET